MKKISLLMLLFSLFYAAAACTSKQTVNKNEQQIVLPDGLPDFVQSSDFEKIDWSRKAIPFGKRGIIGNENKSGVIGAQMPSLDRQKWMWHLWGVGDTELTIIGFHKETQTVHQIVYGQWTLHAGGPNNGADAHSPSLVHLPKPGEWAMLLYTDGKLFDILVYNIKK
ncbi:hypothetical protein [Neobacillus mesonae]|uniref:hypothetical protein n=1 Tax=Neobacillus mesonae TaxID=1193713 RepID=UPI00203F8C79|nr:hypothetical protein [Neobacillus mesonae]MCM3569829.1 hypothetical protein [Neobacillus mesonae]